MAQPRFPSSLLWAGQRRMRPGTPSSGGRSVARSADAWFPPFTRFARCGRCGVEKMPSNSSKLATTVTRSVSGFFVSPPPTPPLTLDFPSSHSHFPRAP